MRVGFTGTRKGMSDNQRRHLIRMLVAFERSTRSPRVPEFHHGGSGDADEEADRLAILDGYAITVHPCPGVVADDGSTGSNGRGKFNGHEVEWREVLPPLVRNRNIVHAVDVLIAAPYTDKEELRSGTWATVRYARKAGKPVVMLSRGE